MTDETSQGVTDEPVAEVQEQAQVQSQEPQLSDREINLRNIANANEQLRRQNDLLQMQLAQREMQQSSKKSNDLDLNSTNDDDIVTYADLKRLEAQRDRKYSQNTEKLKDMEMRSKHKDYDRVIREFLPDVLQDNPDLAEAIKDNPRLHELAYTMAKASPRYHQERLAKANSSAVDKIVANSTNPQPGGSRKNASVQDEDSKLANMSDEQLWATFNMAKARS